VEEGLREAWRTNHRINLLLLENISEAGLLSSLSTRGGRDVARQFAHMHNVRVWALENRRSRDLAEGLVKFPTKVTPSRVELTEALTASAEAIEQFLVDVSSGASNRRGFKKGVLAHLSYFIAHESHHRGSILLTLKQCGHAVDKTTAYAIWDWDRR
jgi:uncharacterized damage-inducible protein DinB